MAEFLLVVKAPVHEYHTYLDQWKAAIDTSLFFERELGEHDFNEKLIRVYIGGDCYMFHLYFEQEMAMMLSLLLLKSIVKRNQLQLDSYQGKYYGGVLSVCNMVGVLKG